MTLAGLERGYKQMAASTKHKHEGDDAKMTFNNWVFLKTPSQHNYKTHFLFTACRLIVSKKGTAISKGTRT